MCLCFRKGMSDKSCAFIMGNTSRWDSVCVILRIGHLSLIRDFCNASPLGFAFFKHSADLLGLTFFWRHTSL